MFKQHSTGYMVSTEGNIKKLKGEGYLKVSLTSAGYLQVCLKGKTRSHHRVVWETFNGDIPKGMQIDHINGNKKDNRLCNLDCVTPSENIKRAIENGFKPVDCGEFNGMAKFTNDDYYIIIDRIVKGDSNNQIAQDYGIHSRYVSLIRHKKRLNSIWDYYESVNGTTIVPNSGDNSRLTITMRLNLISLLESHTNKELASLYNLDPSSVSHIRAKRQWKNIWAIFEDRKSNDHSERK